ncbi:GINS complex Psf3 component [Vararia minispora EC-137]|uniref:GINS complex Psf3 component n=1 Tax=Vararia minispora EC-137 TaxID=1314806 RepID=A0ACB8QQK4_9AGAM|nr:GINS complex Psf3 component [Vararia minispora EC-137]
MDDDYYSIDSILAENQKIQCTFKVDIPDLGHLDGGHERDIKALSKIQLPLWMTYILIFSDYADFTVPAPFSSRVKNALNAECKSVRLSALVGAGASWYAFGKIVMRLLAQDAARDMGAVLTTAFRERLLEVIDQAQHFAALGHIGGAGQSNDTAAAFREGLDATERELFALAQDSARSTKQWYESTDRGRR